MWNIDMEINLEQDKLLYSKHDTESDQSSFDSMTLKKMSLCSFGTFNWDSIRWVKFKNFNPKRVFCFGTLNQWCVRFLSRIFYPFWTAYGQKFWFGYFDRCATRFAPVVRKVSPGFFTHFGRPMVRNSDWVILNVYWVLSTSMRLDG